MADPKKESQKPAPVDGNDWLGNEPERNDLPRYALSEPDADEPDALTVLHIQGVYQATIVEPHRGKDRFLHQIAPRNPDAFKGEKTILLWGNHQIDCVLPTLPPGTRIEITYQGMMKRKGNRPQLKKLLVNWPKGTPRVANPFAGTLKEASSGAEPF